jgi:hypothetical protein
LEPLPVLAKRHPFSAFLGKLALCHWNDLRNNWFVGGIAPRWLSNFRWNTKQRFWQLYGPPAKATVRIIINRHGGILSAI